MKILICNDDGIFSEGILTLAKILKKRHTVVIVAPDGNRSGFSRSMSFNHDITLERVNLIEGVEAYKSSGTPGDCARAGLCLFAKDADIVLSGINLGPNLACDIFYSGTVNACFEANELGYKAIAFSNCAFNDFKFSETAKFIETHLEKLVGFASKEYTLNVNIPNLNADQIKGIKFCTIGKNRYEDVYVKTAENTYRLTGSPLPNPSEDNYSDVYYTSIGYASVTPAKHGVINEKIIEKFRKLNLI